MDYIKQWNIPMDYKPRLDIRKTEVALKMIKDHFEQGLSNALNLTRVSAPLFVRMGNGINDNLNGIERPVSFDASSIDDADIEIVQSLAKWKRIALMRYGFKEGEGLYTDMNAIRRDEETDNLHSIYVDQWDWEKAIDYKDRNEETLKLVVEKIFNTLKSTEYYILSVNNDYEKLLPEEIYFITTQELEDRYPNLTPKEREDKIAEEKRAVFIMKIGGSLRSGMKHDGRSPDYDDWELNGDIILWNPVLNRAFEISSMGIRVDEAALEKQLRLAGCEDRKTLEYHRMLLSGKLPYTIGGGIGQSRMCMFFLKKAHIGEVQAGVWPEEMVEQCTNANILLL